MYELEGQNINETMVSKYMYAFKELKKNEENTYIQNGFECLKEHYASDRYKISMQRLAMIIDHFDHFQTVNLQYGTFAREIKDLTGIEKGKPDSGGNHRMKAIAFDDGERDYENYPQWTLLPEVVVALERLGYVNKENSLEEITFKDFIEKNQDLDYVQFKEKYVELLQKTRTGQADFRKKQLNYWKGCSVTGYKNDKFLIASHIKPYRICNDKESIAINNGLLLIPNIDIIFDKGYISFNSKGEILISEYLSSNDLENLKIKNDMRLRKYNNYFDEFMKYHRENIFKNK